MKVLGVVGLLCLLILSGHGYVYAVEEDTAQIPTVTLRLLDAKVDDIVKDVSKQVDYGIHVEGELKDDIVSGRYKNVPLDQFFHRIFKHKNVIVDIDTQEKNVIVHLFNSSVRKEYVRLKGKGDSDSKLALSNVSLAELEEIFAEEEQLHQAWREDPEAVVPFTRMTKVGFEKIVEQEAEAYQEWKQDPKSKVALSNLTRTEAKSILEQEGQKERVRMQDPNAKIALTDMTQSEYKARMEEEGRRYQQVKNDPNARIPFSNVTYSEFHALGTR